MGYIDTLGQYHSDDEPQPSGESYGDMGKRKAEAYSAERATGRLARAGARAAEQEYELVADKVRQGKSPNWLWNYAQSGGFNDGAKSPNVMIDTDHPRQFATEESRSVKQPMVVVNDGTQRQYSQDPRYAKMREVPVYRDVTLENARARREQERFSRETAHGVLDAMARKYPDPASRAAPKEDTSQYSDRIIRENPFGEEPPALGNVLVAQQDSGNAAGAAIGKHHSEDYQRFLDEFGDRDPSRERMSEEQTIGFNIGRAIGRGRGE